MVKELGCFSAACTTLPCVIGKLHKLFISPKRWQAGLFFIHWYKRTQNNYKEANIESKSKWQATSNYKSSAVSSANGKLACFSFIDINAHKTTTAGEANIESKARLSGKQLQTTNLQPCPPQSWGSTISSVSFPFDTLLCYISRRREAVVLL